MKEDGSRGTSTVWPVIRGMIGDAKKILDVGCGEYVWSYKDAVIKRCDNGQNYYNRTERLKNYRDLDLNGRWPYRDKRFDVVVAADVIEHLESIWNFYRQATRIAKSSIIISTPNVESPMSHYMFEKYGILWGFDKEEREKSHHITPVFEWQVRKALRDNGWRVSAVKKVSTPLPEKRAEKLGIPKEIGCSEENERWIVIKAIPAG